MNAAACQTFTKDCPPFLRWAGSKRRLLPALRKYWSTKHKRYLEPFAGSACLFFSLNPPKAVLGDLNPELVSTYTEVKYRLDSVLGELRKYKPFDKEEYLRLRSVSPLALQPYERAARFIYLNRFCFNGIYRTNLRGEFNVPYSGDGCGGLPGDELFRRCARQLQRTSFLNTDFQEVLKLAEPGDFVYMDPPYAIRERRVFTEYHPATFSFDDVCRLRAWMEKLHRAGVDFVVSYGESAEADILKAGFSYEVVAVRRNIAGFSGHRKSCNEIIITNIVEENA